MGIHSARRQKRWARHFRGADCSGSRIAGAAGIVAAGAAGAADYAASGADRRSMSHLPRWISTASTRPASSPPPRTGWHFAAFDVTTADRAELVALLRDWTARRAARRPADAGAGAVGGSPDAPPDDTGEALGLPPPGSPSPSASAPACSATRAGRAVRPRRPRPAALADLPRFPGDALEPERSGGDLCVQACADDPQVAVHAVRNLARIGFGVVTVRWSQLGFGRTSSTLEPEHAAQPDRLQGRHREPQGRGGRRAGRQHVWVGRGSTGLDATAAATSSRGASACSSRPGTATPLAEQEAIIGRTKGVGAPLTGGAASSTSRTSRDRRATASRSSPRTRTSGWRRPSNNGGLRTPAPRLQLRRRHRPALGRLDAGLFFLAYQTRPAPAVRPAAAPAGHADALNEYIRHTGSAPVRLPAGSTGRRLLGPGPVQLTLRESTAG